MAIHNITLSRTNLLALLAKLDLAKAGEVTSRTIIKYRNPTCPFPQSMDTCHVMAVEDEDYYINRQRGEMHPNTEAEIKLAAAKGHRS